MAGLTMRSTARAFLLLASLPFPAWAQDETEPPKVNEHPTQVALPPSPAKHGSPPAPAKAPKPLAVSTATDSDLRAAWLKWHQALGTLNGTASESGLNALLSLKADLDIRDLDDLGVAAGRAAKARREANDPEGAVTLGRAAVALAPDLPFAHLSLARSFAFADPSSVGRIAEEVVAAVRLFWTHPRYGRAELADVGAALLFAILAVAGAVSVVFFLRSAPLFLHDFHHLFPKAAARWQSGAVALLLLSLPWVARSGVAPVLLSLFAAATLYLSFRERAVLAVLVAAVGLLPVFARVLAEETAFEGTAAQAVYTVEQGGTDAAPLVARLAKRASADQATFAELYALARYELRRGDASRAIEHLKKAASLKANNAGVFTNLGNAMLQKGDVEGAINAYTTAIDGNPAFAPALFDLSKALGRRASTLEAVQAVLEQDHAQELLAKATKLDPALGQRKDPPEDHPVANRLLVNPPLPGEEIRGLAAGAERGEKIERQLSSQLLGDFDVAWALFYPAALAALLIGVGALKRGIATSRACDKCGQPVCHRCDATVPVQGALCSQCVSVFAKRSQVPPRVRVRKQIEIEKHRERMGRASYGLGLLLSGAGHLFAGLPLRGVLYAFLFLFGAFNLFFRQGVLRAPYGSMPVGMRLLPLGLLLLVVYLSSLAGLYRRQSRL